MIKIKFIPLISAVLVLSVLNWNCNQKQEEQNEVRAVWLHHGLFDRNEETAREQISNLFDSYKEIGINNLFCYSTLPDEHKLGWDYLRVLIEEGHKRNIKIHSIFCPGHEVDLEKEKTEHPGWLIHNMDSTLYPGFNLALPEVRQYCLNRISMALKYEIDGIHLDYIRFPVNQRFSYDSLTCTLFKKEYGYSPLEVSRDGGSMIWCEWIKWNGEQVTSLVSEVKDLIVKSGKNVLLGADVFPNLEISKVEIGQDWSEWADRGLVNFVCPMLYCNDLELFKEYLSDAITSAGNKCAVWPGIGIATSHNKITKDLLVQQISMAREEGAGGVVFFSGYSFSEEFRDTLKTTVFDH
ncbi:MAG: glycoside hydrolase family 10 protein [Mangrovibacterium sp.]